LIGDKKIVDNREICNSFNIFLVKGIVNYIYVNPITENDIMNIISKFRNKHAFGYDDVNMVIVKKKLFKAL